MSTRIDAQAPQPFGRIVIIAALAGLFGVMITIIAAATLLLTSVTGTQPSVDTRAPLEPGYMDYGSRQSRLEARDPPRWSPVTWTTAVRQLRLKARDPPRWSPVTWTTAHAVHPGGDRPGRPKTWPLEPGYDDYGQRLRNQQPSR